MPGGVYRTFAEIALVIGFLTTLGATRGRYRTVAFVLLGVCIAHFIVMIVDYRHDQTTHNLGPIEFVALCIYAAPAFAGAIIAHIVDHIRRRTRNAG